MIQPLGGDLLTGTLLHGFLHIVARDIGEQAVYPYTHLVLLLILELSLAVDGPAQKPLGIAAAHDTTGNNFACPRVALADFLDLVDDLFICGGDRRRLPVRLLDIGAEFFRMTEGRILCCNFLPEAPAAAASHFRVTHRRMVLVTVDRPFCTASVCDKHKVLFRQRDLRVPVLRAALDSAGRLLSVRDLKADVCDLCAEPKLHACRLQVFLHRQNQGFVLVVAGEFQSGEVRKAADMVDKSLEVPLHLQGAVPVFKGEHGSPVKPELGAEYLIIEHILDGFVIEILILREEELHDLHTALLAQTKLSVRMGILSAALCGTTERIVRVMLV